MTFSSPSSKKLPISYDHPMMAPSTNKRAVTYDYVEDATKRADLNLHMDLIRPLLNRPLRGLEVYFIRRMSKYFTDEQLMRIIVTPPWSIKLAKGLELPDNPTTDEEIYDSACIICGDRPPLDKEYTPKALCTELARAKKFDPEGFLNICSTRWGIPVVPAYFVDNGSPLDYNDKGTGYTFPHNELWGVPAFLEALRLQRRSKWLPTLSIPQKRITEPTPITFIDDELAKRMNPLGYKKLPMIPPALCSKKYSIPHSLHVLPVMDKLHPIQAPVDRFIGAYTRLTQFRLMDMHPELKNTLNTTCMVFTSMFLHSNSEYVHPRFSTPSSPQFDRTYKRIVGHANTYPFSHGNTGAALTDLHDIAIYHMRQTFMTNSHRRTNRKHKTPSQDLANAYVYKQLAAKIMDADPDKQATGYMTYTRERFKKLMKRLAINPDYPYLMEEKLISAPKRKKKKKVKQLLLTRTGAAKYTYDPQTMTLKEHEKLTAGLLPALSITEFVDSDLFSSLYATFSKSKDNCTAIREQFSFKRMVKYSKAPQTTFNYDILYMLATLHMLIYRDTGNYNYTVDILHDEETIHKYSPEVLKYTNIAIKTYNHITGTELPDLSSLTIAEMAEILQGNLRPNRGHTLFPRQAYNTLRGMLNTMLYTADNITTPEDLVNYNERLYLNMQAILLGTYHPHHKDLNATKKARLTYTGSSARDLLTLSRSPDDQDVMYDNMINCLVQPGMGKASPSVLLLLEDEILGVDESRQLMPSSYHPNLSYVQTY